MTEQELIETNQRLHRRCQKAESEANYYKLRYEGLKNALDERLGRIEGISSALRKLHHEEYLKEWDRLLNKQKWWKVGFGR